VEGLTFFNSPVVNLSPKVTPRHFLAQKTLKKLEIGSFFGDVDNDNFFFLDFLDQ